MASINNSAEFDDDDSAFEALKQGVPAALDYFYLKYRVSCVRYLLANIIYKQDPNRQEVALDLFKDALIVTADNAQQGKLKKLTAKIYVYINNVARNIYLKQKQKRKEKPTAPNELIAPLAMPDYTDDEQQLIYQKLHQLIKSLGEACRKNLVYFYFLKMDNQAITQRLGYKNEVTTRNARYKCMERLRKLYGQ